MRSPNLSRAKLLFVPSKKMPTRTSISHLESDPLLHPFSTRSAVALASSLRYSATGYGAFLGGDVIMALLLFVEFFVEIASWGANRMFFATSYISRYD